ncbi:uncharacterized protein LOC143621964 [Bidens hawaiensis]|uniref:uncharacterized protein LOC143621964 n=1 Tax=Bidens hawaiensis TaxID=980011 RepID=UPI00404977EF
MRSKGQDFSLTWFDKYDHDGNQGGRNVFSKEGFNSWNKPERLSSHEGDKDVANFFEEEILNSIFKDTGDDMFALLVAKSSDVSKKEQMAIVLRDVDIRGLVKERFVGLVPVMETSSSVSKGQGYDGANNMHGQFNGLKAKILEENYSTYYVHCFAHQLQLVVATVAKKHLGVVNFFDNISILINVVCGSCYEQIFFVKMKKRVEKEIGGGILETGSGLNQELSFTRPGDTRWNSYYKTLLRLVDIFPSIMRVVEHVKEECTNPSTQNQAINMLGFLSSFEFVFYLHLTLHILGLSEILSRAHQRKDQDIVEAVSLVESTKRKRQCFRKSGFNPLLKKIH